VCWSFGVVGLKWYPCCRLQPARRIPLQSNHTETPTHIEPRTIRPMWFEACNTDTTPTQPHRNSNTHRTKNNTTNVVIQQNSRKLLTMDILMSETCWAHKKWNKIASDIKLVFYSSTITMMHGPINIKSIQVLSAVLGLLVAVWDRQTDDMTELIDLFLFSKFLFLTRQRSRIIRDSKSDRANDACFK